MNLKIPSPLTKINSHFLKNKGVELYIKRDDLIHEIISGNKWRKLKYNFLHAKNSKRVYQVNLKITRRHLLDIM